MNPDDEMMEFSEDGETWNRSGSPTHECSFCGCHLNNDGVEERDYDIDDVFLAFEDIHNSLEFIEEYFASLAVMYSESEEKHETKEKELLEEVEMYKKELSKAYQELAAFGKNKE